MIDRIQVNKVIDKETGELISEHSQLVAMNRDFVQFYRSQLHAVADLGRADPLALAVWLWIVERMGRDNALVCSMAPLVEYFQRSRQTISKKVGILLTKGYLGIAKSGTTNIYLANADLVWTSNAARRRTAEFRANVVLSESEQSRAADPFKKSAPPPRLIKRRLPVVPRESRWPSEADASSQRRPPWSRLLRRQRCSRRDTGAADSSCGSTFVRIGRFGLFPAEAYGASRNAY